MTHEGQPIEHQEVPLLSEEEQIQGVKKIDNAVVNGMLALVAGVSSFGLGLEVATNQFGDTKSAIFAGAFVGTLAYFINRGDVHDTVEAENVILRRRLDQLENPQSQK